MRDVYLIYKNRLSVSVDFTRKYGTGYVLFFLKIIPIWYYNTFLYIATCLVAKKYYICSMINITNEDNMGLMARYPDNHFDLAIVDPPYFKEYSRKNYTGSELSKTNVKRQVEQIKHWNIPDSSYFNELIRVSRNQIIWGCNYYAKNIDSVGRIVWDKKNDTSTFSKCEIASHSFGIRVDKFSFRWNGMIQENMKNKEKRIHPTQKPVKLYEWLLTNYAKEGDKILDTHLGSGSIAIACHNLGFDLTACELDADYYNSALKRLKDHVAQQRLFL